VHDEQLQTFFLFQSAAVGKRSNDFLFCSGVNSSLWFCAQAFLSKMSVRFLLSNQVLLEERSLSHLHFPKIANDREDENVVTNHN